MNQLRLRTIALAVLSVALVGASFAPAVHARHAASSGALVHLATELERAAADAARLAARVNHRHGPEAAVTESFYRLADAAAEYRRAARGRSTEASTRAFDAMVNRYWDLRSDFRQYHGPDSVRRGFHQVNDPMERIYFAYTGRDLYRDDPGIRTRSGHAADRIDRYQTKPAPHASRGRTARPRHPVDDGGRRY